MLEFESDIKNALGVGPKVIGSSEIATLESQSSSIILVESTEKLGKLIRELNQILGWQTDENYIKNAIRHEGQHHVAARIICAKYLVFGVEIITGFPNNFEVTYTPFHRYRPRQGTTLLESAAVAAYPVDPSLSDVEAVYSFGFDGIEDVAERAMWNNRTTSRHIPVPLSYRLK